MTVPSAKDAARDDGAVPLVLDVDGTLLRTDLLYECFWAAMGRDVPATLRVALTRTRHPARMKHDLAAIAAPAIERLPVREAVLERARAAVKAGRPVHLVSGSPQALVDALARRLDLPGPHFGSDPDHNLTDAAKAAFLADRFGPGGYDYVGNAHADLRSWQGARRVIAVAPPAGVRRALARLEQPVEIIEDGWRPSALLRELRPHQWVKNLLLFAPMLAAQHFEWAVAGQVALATVAFSLGASAIYVLNDLLDLDADRRHPEKRTRPLASGALPIPLAMGASAVLVALALILALAVGPPVAGLTMLYMAGSLGYSLWLKKRRWLDVLALAGLFLLRVLTGAVAAGVGLPPILMVFGFAVFFVLACAKRITALSRLPVTGHLPGRGYVPADLARLGHAAHAAIGVVAVLYLGYGLGPSSAGFYDNQLLFALAVLPLIYWLWRMVRLAAQGREDFDPVRFVLRDRQGLLIALLGIVMIALAV